MLQPRILVVDDDELVRNVLKTILESNGYEVLTATNGREGVDIFHREGGRVDTVLLDLNMPVLDGEQALEELRKTGANVPIWIMTGYDALNRDVKLAADKRVAGVLRKPISTDTLIQAIASSLRP